VPCGVLAVMARCARRRSWPTVGHDLREGAGSGECDLLPNKRACFAPDVVDDRPLELFRLSDQRVFRRRFGRFLWLFGSRCRCRRLGLPLGLPRLFAVLLRLLLLQFIGELLAILGLALRLPGLSRWRESAPTFRDHHAIRRFGLDSAALSSALGQAADRTSAAVMTRRIMSPPVLVVGWKYLAVERAALMRRPRVEHRIVHPIRARLQHLGVGHLMKPTGRV